MPVDRINEIILCPCCGGEIIIQVAAISRERSAVDWAKVDWTKSDRDIARHIGRSATLVVKARGKFAPQTRRPKINWASVDFARSHTELIAMTGASSTMINKMRHRFAPHSVGNTGLRAPHLI